MTNFEKWKENLNPEVIALFVAMLDESPFWTCDMCPAKEGCRYTKKCYEEFIKWANKEVE